MKRAVRPEHIAFFNKPAIKFSVSEACDSFTLSIQSCVEVFGTLEGLNGYKLNSGDFPTGSDLTYTFPDLEDWPECKCREATRWVPLQFSCWDGRPSTISHRLIPWWDKGSRVRPAHYCVHLPLLICRILPSLVFQAVIIFSPESQTFRLPNVLQNKFELLVVKRLCRVYNCVFIRDSVSTRWYVY